MAPLLSLLTWSTLAVLLASFSPTPVSALSLHSHEARISPNHGELAKRMSQHQRQKRCKPRTSVPPAPASTSSEAPKPTSKPEDHSDPPAAPPKTDKPKPSSPPSSAPAANNVWQLFPNKALLAWGNTNEDLPKWSQFASRLYTWGTTLNRDVDQYGFKSCPMLWGWKNVQDFADTVLNSDAAVDCALGMNEPEIPSQGNMSPEDAADLWVKYLVPLKQKKGTLLGTPAVTSDTPTNYKWMDRFFAACKDRTGDAHCLADFMPLHYYDISAQGFKDFLGMMHGKYNLPIAVTEYGDHNFNGPNQANAGEVWNFAGEMKTFFRQTDWIIAYAPFGCIRKSQLPDINPLNAIMGDNGLPTDLGYFYYGS